jgi:hypothetical protein
MPAFIHNRAEHILAKNPSMPKSEAFAIATQQSHALGKSPKGYGTADGKATAKAKYQTPGDDKKTANPGHLESPKMAAPNLYNNLTGFWRAHGGVTPPGFKTPAQRLQTSLNTGAYKAPPMKPLDIKVAHAFLDELTKTAGLGETLKQRAPKFLEAAKAELGPAAGAVLGAGAANAFGVNPLAGAAAGYGVGAIPEIVHGIRHRATV